MKAAFVFAALAVSLSAQTITTVSSLTGIYYSGVYWPLVQGSDGNFYGTSWLGGAYGGGEFFSITPEGAATVLYSFCPQTPCTDGYAPAGGLVQVSPNEFAGVASSGGGTGLDQGTLFEIDSSGNLQTLVRFEHLRGTTEGSLPYGGLVRSASGVLYGTTGYGGKFGRGTVFSMATDGTITTLHSFCAKSGCPDGEDPGYPPLVLTASGDLYGVATKGGTAGSGTIFKINADGKFTTLYSFCSQGECSGLIYPLGIVQGADGAIYGITQLGGANQSGSFYKVTAEGTFTTVYSFCSQSNCTDGKDPLGALVRAANGDIYGETNAGGNAGYGTIYRVTPAGKLKTVYHFCVTGLPSCADGGGPGGGLTLGSDGSYYGTNGLGGANGYGTFFRFSPPQ